MAEVEKEHRQIALTTDDADRALEELHRRREQETGWDMAEVRLMENPPMTVNRYCVFRSPPA